MRKLPLLVFILSAVLLAQSPHGKNFSLDCSLCHKSDTWKISDSTGFDHGTTAFKLTGRHIQTNCRQCHATLLFGEAKTNCSDCHRDVHKGSVSPECAKCHTPANWLVTNINKMHQLTRFPLQGIHTQADCKSCHMEYNTLNFTVLGTACYDCHTVHFQQAQNPNHVAAGFDKNCQICHSVSSSSWRTQSFKHEFFPLTGMHKLENCYACHNKTSFSGLSSQCYACHEKNYKATTNPNHLQQAFSTQCQVCHTINGWKPASFDHGKTNFPLTGAHLAVTCESCHITAGITPSTDCYSCHKTKYEQTTSPNHVVSGLDQTCKNCHTTNAWKPASFNHNTTAFPLTGAHVSANCSQCHITAGVKPLQDCYACHKSNYDLTSNPNHAASGIDKTCNTCHSTTAWKPASFDHNATAFPLTGSHVTANCASCHVTPGVKPSMDCYSCHKTKYDQTSNPNHTAAGFDKTCKTCHSTTAWQPATFNHDGLYFPIYTGEHKGKWNTCADCHTTAGNYEAFSCINCHEHNKTSMDNEHRNVNGYAYQSTACLSCHPKGKGDGAFNHQTSTFPLTGNHITAACEKCHITGYTTALPVDCNSCHAQQAIPASAPNHQLPGFSKICSDCHNTTDFKQTTFNHTATQFPLQGKHVTTTCNACHITQYTATPKVCNDCHQNDLQNAASVNHTLAGFTQPCSECHTQTGWTPATYTHPNSFALTGKHTSTSCVKCHATQYANSPKECKGCHTNDYNNAVNPNHRSANFSQICQDCHTTTKWQGATFNHDPKFPIYSGKHKAKWQLCSECHAGNNFNDYSCTTCHEHALQTTNQQHTTVSGYIYSSHECKACHPTGSETGSFNHSQSAFPLTGAHIAIQCSDCHVNGYVQKPSTECKICHNSDLTPVTNPDHKIGNFSQVCTDCHNTTKWKPSSFNHTTGTLFPLQGAHITATCNKCHTTQYANTSKVCKECHNTAFQQSTNPNHTLASFTQPCEQCHSATAWKPSTYNHSTTGYTLVGKHVTTDCNKCHVAQYANTPTDCYTCHTNTYNNTTTPKHAVSNISTECKTCHTPNNWTTTLNYTQHDGLFFPIYTGEHRSKWTKCTDCHRDATNYSTNSCIDCHEHNLTSMNNEHRNVSGYVYQSAQCLRCHPKGNSASAFNHATSTFRLTGAHLAVSCNSCHANGYAGTPTDCNQCHLTDYNNTQNPNHAAIGMGTACSTCHTTAAWTPSGFSHANTVFPLTGVHISTNCASCHVGATTGTGQLCKSCHLQKFQATTNPNHVTLNISQDCQTCHTTNANWKPATFPNHAAYWAFQGAHIAIKDNCTQCHNNNYTGTHTCYSCHQAKYASTVSPPHVQYNISQVCSTCHTQTAWTPATFNHSFYPISNKHRNVTCKQCHSLSGYNPQCLSCHQADYIDGHNGTGHPNCYQCHDTNDFDDKKLNKPMDNVK